MVTQPHRPLLKKPLSKQMPSPCSGLLNRGICSRGTCWSGTVERAAAVPRPLTNLTLPASTIGSVVDQGQVWVCRSFSQTGPEW